MQQVRCINLDWLEVFAFEIGRAHDADYFRERGYIVFEREYGTRIYEQMFTILDDDGHPLIEVRRKPKSALIPETSTHIRLHNRTCYFNDAANIMQDFINSFDYIFQRISRVDICLDFCRFDDNTIPRIFMQRYMRGKFSKVNQANIHSHGSDSWTGRVWNSVSWGSPTSPVSTKFYNKTLELYDPKTERYGKPYIRQAWLQAGLIDDFDRCTLKGIKQEIWRVEFSIKSAVKKWMTIELDGKNKKYQSIHNTLDMYNSRDKLIVMFAALAQHYFHFKRYVMEQRKDRCPDRVLFKWSGQQRTYKVEHNSVAGEQKAPDYITKLIADLRTFSDATHNVQLRKQADELCQALTTLALREQLAKPWSHDQLLAMQVLMHRRVEGDMSDTFETLLQEVKKALSINDRTLVF